MKKQIPAIILSAVLMISLCGCSNSRNDQSGTAVEPTDLEEEISFAPTSDITVQSSSETEVSTKISSQPQDASIPEYSFDIEVSEDSSPETLPENVQRAGTGKLRYSASVLSLRVSFPDIFCVRNNDYIPDYGIYLRNTEGTATLLLESVTDNTMTASQMSRYVRGQYPSAKVYTTDQKDIVCKMDMLDQSGKQFYLMQKIRVKSGGYSQIVMCCKPEEKSIYERYFLETNFI